MTRAVLALIVAASAFAALAAPPERDTQQPASVDATTKPAWQWTDEERIAARFDPTHIASRLRDMSSARRRTADVPPPSDARVYDFIEGRSHPELFLPTELFDHLVFSAYASSGEFRDTTRELLTRDGVSVGLPPDFLQQLQTYVDPAAVTFQQEHDLIRSDQLPSQARIDALVEIRARRCRGVASGLAAAYRLFGKENFDRFLYTAIAPHHFQQWFEPPSREALQRIAGGCR